MTNLSLTEYAKKKEMSPFININQLSVRINAKEKLTNINKPTKYDNYTVNNNVTTLNINSKNIFDKESIIVVGVLSVTSTKPKQKYEKLNQINYTINNNLKTLVVTKKFDPTDFIDSKLIDIDSKKTASNGLDSFSVEVNAGRMCNIKLKESDSFITISGIENLPSSLYFDEKDNSIKGVPFILGEHLVIITLANLNKIKLILKILPDDNFKIL